MPLREQLRLSHREILGQMVTARLKKNTAFPQCDCQGNPATARKWKEHAEKNVREFILQQFGKEPDEMSRYEKQLLKQRCAPFFTQEQNEHLSTLTGRPSNTFWSELYNLGATQVTDAQLLANVIKFFKNKIQGRSLAEVAEKLSNKDRFNLRRSPLIIMMSEDQEAQLGLIKSANLAKKKIYDPSYTLQQIEDTLIRQGANRDVNDRLTMSHEKWKDLSNKYIRSLPQDFILKYNNELHGRKAPGRKALHLDENNRVVKTKKSKQVKPVMEEHEEMHDMDELILPRVPSVKKSGFRVSDFDDLDMPTQVTKSPRVEPRSEPRVEKQRLIVKEAGAPKRVRNDEQLSMFIGSLARKSDTEYPPNPNITSFTDFEWLLMDANRDAISDTLLSKYSAYIMQARKRLNNKTGGAYASISSNKDLAMAYIVSAYFCGDI